MRGVGGPIPNLHCHYQSDLTSSRLSEDIFGRQVWQFLTLNFLQTRNIFPIVLTENENSTAGKTIQFPLVSSIRRVSWVSEQLICSFFSMCYSFLKMCQTVRNGTDKLSLFSFQEQFCPSNRLFIYVFILFLSLLCELASFMAFCQTYFFVGDKSNFLPTDWLTGVSLETPPRWARLPATTSSTRIMLTGRDTQTCHIYAYRYAPQWVWNQKTYSRCYCLLHWLCF